MKTVTNTQPPPMTFEQVMVILAEQKAETFAKIEIDKAIHREEMKKRDAEMAKRDDAMNTEMAKREKEMKIFKKEMKELSRKFENVSRKFGNLNNRFGDIVEGMVSPNLKTKFKKYGFSFGGSATNCEVFDEGKVITEIDVLLHDGDSIMAVEIKTKPTFDDIEHHLWRIEQTQKYPSIMTRGMKIYGAIACAVINSDVMSAAFSAGFYVICQSGDSVNIVPPPASFVPRYWYNGNKN
jgi:hypothetical protein